VPKQRVVGPRPMKELGQHFLADEETASNIVQAMNLRWEDRSLEIGPGRGVMLRFLLKQSHKVTAIELDARLKRSLEMTFGGHPGLDLVFDDFLKFDLLSYIDSADSPVKLVGNIPYNLSAPILIRLFDLSGELQRRGNNALKSATLMLQKEVAARICARPGGRIYGGITVQRSLVADAELLFTVPPESFIPSPKITSAVIRLDFFSQHKHDIADLGYFKDLVRHVFLQRRKMIKNTIGGLHWIQPDWKDIEFDLTKRPEELSLEKFIELFNKLKT